MTPAYLTPLGISLFTCMAITFLSVIIVMCSKPSEAQKWLFIATVSALIYFAANYYHIFAATIEIYLITYKAIYVATAYLILGTELGLMAVCEIHIPAGIRNCIVAIFSLLAIVMCTFDMHHAWMKSYVISERIGNPGYVCIQADNGWLYYVVNIVLLGSLLMCAIYMIYILSRFKGDKQKALSYLLLFISLPLFTWLLAVVNIIPSFIANHIQIAVVALAITILQIRYDILMTIPVAKEQIVEHSDEGIIILDSKKHFLYANDTAKKVMPELSNNNNDKVTAYILESIQQKQQIHIGENYYALSEENVVDNGRSIGSTIWIRNVTSDILYKLELLQKSQMDQMTQLYNRGGGEQKISELLEDHTVGMFCLLDVDNFKHFNDFFGHMAGDKVLIAIADCLRRSFGTNAVVMRLGGDEFAVFMLGMTKEKEGRKQIQTFFDNVTAIQLPEINGKRISVSIGAAIYNGQMTTSFDELYRKADECTYRSKEKVGCAASFEGEY